MKKGKIIFKILVIFLIIHVVTVLTLVSFVVFDLTKEETFIKEIANDLKNIDHTNDFVFLDDTGYIL